MPWRAFGGSEPTRSGNSKTPHVVSFNALAGVRGFGGDTSLSSTVARPKSGFNALAGVRGFGANSFAPSGERNMHVSMPWRAFGGSEVTRETLLCGRSMSFNALAGVRGFGASSCSCHRLSALSRFNALAGVRGFGANGAQGRCQPCQWVSMPWRAFGGSEPVGRIGRVGRMSFNALAGVRGFGARGDYAQPQRIHRVSMPWRAFGGSEDLGNLHTTLRCIFCFNALAGVRGFGDTMSKFRLVGHTKCFNALAGVRGFGEKSRPAR